MPRLDLEIRVAGGGGGGGVGSGHPDPWIRGEARSPKKIVSFGLKKREKGPAPSPGCATATLNIESVLLR